MKEHLENFELSVNQKRSQFLYRDHLQSLNHVLSVRFTTQPEVQKLSGIITEIVQTHETLTSAIYHDEEANFPLQTPHYFSEAHIVVQASSEFKQWNSETTEKPKRGISYPASFYLFVDSNERVEYLIIKAQSFWTDLFGCFIILENIQTKMENRPILNEEAEDFIVHRNFAAWQNELIREEDNEGLLFWSNYTYDLSQKNIPFGKLSNSEFRPQKIRLLKMDREKFKTVHPEELELDFLIAYISYLKIYQPSGITLGYALFSRVYEELNETIGLVTKTVPLEITQDINEIRPEAKNTLAALLEELKDWSDYFGAEDLERETKPQKFQTNFQFIDLHERQIGMKSFVLESLFSTQETFEIKLEVIQFEDHIEIALYYDQNVFNEQEIRIIKSQLTAKLKNKFDSEATDNSTSVISEVMEHLEAEVSLSQELEFSVIDLIEAQIQNHPKALALSNDQTQVTYADLAKKMKAIASSLQGRFNKTLVERPVAILLEDSIEYVITAIGILKAGGHFLPLDLKNPIDRLEFILRDSNSLALVTSESSTLNLQFSGERLTFFELTEQQQSGSGWTFNPSGAAYMIYTSGSTGQPKGVKVGHRSLLNYVKWARSFYPEGNAALFTSMSFDLTLTSLFLPLVNGKTVVSINENLSVDEKLIRVLEDDRFQLVKLTPSHINLINILDVKAKGKKSFICGGEALSQGQARTLFNLTDKNEIEVYNEYGPTEATIGCVAKKILPGDGTVTIGRPITNVRLKIRKEGKSCTVGQPGELWIGGACLALGYLNLPQKNENTFVTVEPTGDQFYKTGDLVRILPNGELDYLGRIDKQVKINGYRVELGEIENQLCQIPGVSSAAVLYNGKTKGESLLQAFFQADNNILVDQIKASLGKSLPEYMVPQNIYHLDRLPLTSNGKLDRQALQEMNVEGLFEKAEYVPPQTDEEQKMVAIFGEVLQRSSDKIGVKDRFFEMGGDSIKAIRLMVQLRKILDYKLTVEDIYNYDTVESLVNYAIDHSEQIDRDDEERRVQKERVELEIESLKQRVFSAGILKESEVEDVYPMSDIEKGMVFGYLMNEGTGTYHDQMVFTKRFEDFNLSRFEKALNALGAKHEILRTGFDLNNFETEIQIVYRTIEHKVYFEDVSTLSRHEQERYISDFLREKRQHKFRTENAPLWRMSVFRAGTDNFVFVFEFHHAIIDGWSDASFITELNNLYLKLAEDPTYVPEPLKSTYRDFIIEQEIGRADEEVREFWKTELADHQRMELFTEKEEIARFSRSRGQDYLNQLNNCATELNTTVKTVALSAYLVLLQLLNGESEVLTGLVTNNRPNTTDGDKIIGCFLNTIPLKTKVDPEDQFSKLIQMVHQKSVSLKKYEGLSLFAINEVCQEKSEQTNPFFDVMFNYVDFHILKEVKHDLEAEKINSSTTVLGIESHERTNTYFDFTVSSTGNHFGLLISATNKLKSGLSVEYVGALYFKILDAILEDVTRKPAQIQLMEEQELTELIEELNDTIFPFQTDENLIDYFEQQVLIKGESTAIIDVETELTYKELNERSNLLANYLIGLFANEAHEVKNVGVMLERSVKSVIAMLGIMKAGGCYIPLNHEYPSERINYVLNDAGLFIVIGEEELLQEHGVQLSTLINLDEILRSSNNSEKQLLKNPTRKNKLDDVAAIFYTSGSTGKPKGVLQTHRMMRNLIHWDVELSGVEKGLKHLQFNSFSFDACIQDVFFALCSGGSLYMVKESSRLDYPQLLEEVVSNEVEVIFMPFSALNAFAHEVEIGTLKKHSIKYIISTAEQLVINNPLKQFLENNPDIQLRNYYGPSETHIVTHHVMSAAADNLESPSPVGKPIANSQIFILNNSGQMVPKGVIGEIYIGGENLAAGYLNLKKVTDEKFVENSFAKAGKLYKTGDHGYWRSDNNLIFLGRKDDQIKIRGFRVETGEIEYAICEHAEIEKAVVLARKNQEGEYVLVAYFQPGVGKDDQKNPDRHALRSYLKQQLPDYMIPAYYVKMDVIPLTNNGKIDKKALPLPDNFGWANDEVYTAPQNELQQKLVGIWEDILKRKEIGIRNDFFALGGHSLKVIRLSNAYQKEFGVKVSLKTLFEKVTIEQQYNLIRHSHQKSFKPIPPLEPQESYPISDAQRRLWVLSQFEDEAVSYNMPNHIYLSQEVDIELFKKAVLLTVSRHEILRTVFRENSKGEIRQWVRELSELNFKIDYRDFRQSSQESPVGVTNDEDNQAEQVDRYIRDDMYKPFDFENGPLIRAAVLQVEEQRFVFYYNLHHIISDGSSGAILAGDVMHYYDVLVGEEGEIDLKPLEVQYKDYSVWQLTQLETPTFKAHRDFWLKQLSGNLPLIELPTSKKRPSLKTNEGSTFGTYLNEEVSTNLKDFCQQQGGTLFMGLLASLNAMLFRYTSQQDLIIGTPVAGREHPDLENQIGFYVNTLALRNKVREDDSFQGLFLRAKENVFNAFAHQMYPFDRLVDELDLVRDTSRSVVFDIMLVFQNDSESNGVNDKIETEKIFDYGAKTSKFDLLITAKEVGGKLFLLFEYNTDVYESQMIERFITHYKTFIEQVVIAPKAHISKIDYLTPAERNQLLIGLNETKIDFAEDLVMELFEKQVLKTPQKIAVRQGAFKLTYEQLNEQSNRLAHEIRARYLTNLNKSLFNDLKIGVMLERSINSVVAMIGVMKSGAVYVPIANDYPEERVSFIVNDAQLTGVICDSKMGEKHQFELPLYIESINESTDYSNPECLNLPENAAFIIYTSGSTGKPKGVAQTHRMLQNLINWDTSQSGIERELKHLHYNAFSFDVSIQDCWSPLCAGGTIYLTTQKDRIDFNAVWNTIVEQEIEVLSFPFSALQQLIIQNEKADYSRLKVKHIISAGEQLVVNKPLRTFLNNNPNVKLHNHYGPSESHVVTSHTMSGALQNIETYAPVGQPVANTQIYILDTFGNPVPQGVTGELYISGANLSQGYLNLQNETDERFIPHLFLPDQKLYRTGDQAKWQLDGNIVFTGRADDQVKIRGYRIELQEVENALLNAPAITETMVQVIENDVGEKELAAWVIAREPLKIEDLRALLMQKIPFYMLPTHFIQVDKFELTTNGKIDKGALPDPYTSEAISSHQYVAPTNEIEKKLVSIWEEVLQHKNIGVRDDFFMLGGHSLKAAKVVSKINQEFKSGLKIGHIFSTPTIADLAYNIEFALNQKERKSKIQNMKEIEL